MTKSAIYDYFKKQTDEIKINFFRALVTYEELPIHDLRVAVKRLRALIKFLKEQHISSPDAVSFIRQLNKIYKPLGHIRDLQIKTNLIRSFNNDDQEYFKEYVTALEKRQKWGRYKLQGSGSTFYYSAFLIFKRHKPFCPGRKINLNHRKVISERITRIRRHMRHENQELHLHQIRKRLKEIYYCMEMNGLEHIKIRSINLDLSKIRKLEDIIGKWRDTHLFEQTLQQDNPAFFNINEKGQLQKIKNNIRRQNRKRFNYISNQLTQTIS